MSRLLIALATVVILSGCSVLDSSRVNASEKSAETLLLEAEELYAKGRFDEAEQLFLKASSLNPSDAQILYRLGTISFRKGKQDLAADYFVKTIEINPRNSKAHFNLATIRLMQAESHFKYFIATTDPKADIHSLSSLLGAIEEYASSSQK